MSEDWFYVTTTIVEQENSRPSTVLRANGEPFYLERKKGRIGFDLKPRAGVLGQDARETKTS